MALDLTNAVSLSRLVNKKLPAHTWLWNKFFKSEEHDTATIAVDIVSGSNRLACFKRVGAESDAVNSDNFTTKQFGPNQIGEKILTKAFDFAKRAPGMQLSYASGEKTIEERVADKLGRDQRKLIDRVWRAIEKMCADALFTDTVNNYDAKGNLIESFAMGVPSSHKIVKTGNDLWTAATADPFEQLAEFEVLVSQDSALDVTDYVLGKNAAKAFLSNAKAIEKLKINRGMFGVIDPKKPEAGAKFLGYTAEGANIWWCTETYEDSAGTKTAYVPDDYCLAISKDIEATVHFGLIDDPKACKGGFVGQIFSKTWEDEDVGDWLKVASAPLAIITQPEALVYAKVV